MLRFFGTRYKGGSFTKFFKEYRLTESIHVALSFVERFPNFDEANLSIKEEINKYYESNSVFNSADVAILTRAKDIISFIAHPISGNHRLEILKVLADKGSIEDKWNTGKKIMINFLKVHALDATVAISDRNSGVSDTLEAIKLFFMDQADETPPANIILYFTPNEFPSHFWSDTNTITERKSVNWVPENPMLRKEYLISDLVLSMSEKSVSNVKDLGNVEVPDFSKIDPISTKISFTSKHFRKENQLEFIDEINESFLYLQRSLPKVLKDDTTRLFLAIFYLLQSNPKSNACFLDLEDLCQITSSAQQESQWRKNFATNSNAALELISELEQVIVERSYEIGGKTLTVSNSLLKRIGDVWIGKSNSCIKKVRIVKDDLLLFGTSFPPGFAIRAFPDSYFSSKVKSKHYFEVSGYLASYWLQTWGDKESNRFRITPRKIIDNSGLTANKNQYRTVQNIKEALEEMEKNKLLEKLKYNINTKENVYEQEYDVIPSEFVRTKLSELHEMAYSPNYLS